VNAPVPIGTDPGFDQAAAAFRRFFGELREAFIEREPLFTQIELGLLCREHVLILGPPGTAKSAIASAVVGRITDEKTGRPSVFQKQLAENTVQTDLIGPVDFKVLTETGRTEHLTDEGMLGAVHAFLDEVFDGRDMLLRSILNVLQERELKHGRKVTRGLCECALMTSNRYLSEVLQRSPETLQAFADRVSFVCFTPKAFARPSSRAQMLLRAQTGQRPALHEPLTLQQVDVLQDMVTRVDVPGGVAEGLELLTDALERELLSQVVKLPDYVPTKYFSQRSIVKGLWVLKAVVVRDKILNRHDRRLVAEVQDLQALRSFFLLGGPVQAELDALLKAAADPRERAQLEIIRVEHKAFEEALARVLPTLTRTVEREATDLKLKEEVGAADALTRAWSPAVAASSARSLREKLVPGPRHASNRAELLRAAATLVSALEVRLSMGMTGQGEGRGGVQLLSSFGEALELVRRIPEFKDRVTRVAEGITSFLWQATEMICLAAEGTEFDDAMKLEGLVSLADNLADELSRLSQLLQVTALLAPEPSEGVQTQVSAARERVAHALAQRAERFFARAETPRGGEPLVQLMGDSRRLAELEEALVELSPAQQGLRMRLLGPAAEAYATEVLSTAPFRRLPELVQTIRTVVDNVKREGGDTHPVLMIARDIVERRVGEYAQVVTKPPAVAMPQASQVFSGEAYTAYRQQLSASALDGEVAALEDLDAILQQGGLAILRSELKAALTKAEVVSLGARIRYLRGWLTALLDRLPDSAKISSRAEADQAFDSFVRSRFPMLVTREGELLRLDTSLSRLDSLPAGLKEEAQQLDTVLRATAEDFATFSRELLEARARG